MLYVANKTLHVLFFKKSDYRSATSENETKIGMVEARSSAVVRPR